MKTSCLFARPVITAASVLAAYSLAAGVGGLVPAIKTQRGPKPSVASSSISVKGLDLSRPPTTDELVAAGQLGGPLFPTHELQDKQRAEAAHWAFGKAIEEWNKHEYPKAVGMFRSYLEEYPDSPWAAEAELHIGCDATYNGRYTEAEVVFNKLIAVHQGKDHPGARMLVSKARQRLALLKVEQNNLEEAGLHFRSLLQESPDWRHRTYASHWLQRLSRYAAAGQALVNCGAEALAYALEKEGRHAAAAQVSTNLPATMRGHTLASLARLAASQGLELAAVQVAPADLAGLPLPALLHITPQHVGDKGHYWVLDGLRGEQVELFDPQSRRRFAQSLAELAREWSGRALVFSKGRALPGRRLELSEMEEASGGCCGVPRDEDDLGCTGSHGRAGAPQGGCTSCGQIPGGAPVWSVNMINMNLFVTDTPLWYDPPIGPPVSIELSYNSQSATAQNEPFGNKWQFNYASYLVVDTAGTVLVFMPDGARNAYAPDGTGGYVRPYQVYNTLTRIAPNSFELRFPDDTVYAYRVPAGSGSQQPFLAEIRDAWGQKLSFGYDADVRLTTITDAQGLVTTLSYNDAGLITNVADPFGRHATFEYDGDQNLIRSTDMGGYWSSFTCDSNAYLTSLGDERGTWSFRIEPADGIYNDFDPYPPPGGTMYENYRITIIDPMGYPSEYHYNGYASYAWYVSSRDYVPWRSEYENNFKLDVPKTIYHFTRMNSGRQGELSSITFPEGDEVDYEYDTQTGCQTSVTDAYGNTLACDYNSMGQITLVTDPSGTLTTLSYAANGIDLLSVSNGLGQVLMRYNGQHQVVAVWDPLKKTTAYAYNAFGQLTSEVDALGITNEYVYDANDRLCQIARAGQVLKTMTHDAIGRIRTQTDATGLTLTNDYSALDQLTRITYPDGRFVSYVYSPCCPGLLDSITDRAARTTRFTYDALKRLIQVSNPDGSLTQYAYDANGNRTRTIDPNGNVTEFAYDLDDRLVTKTYPDGKGPTFRYDNAGLLASRTDARGIVTTYNYDANHNLTRMLYSDGTPGITNTYDSFGRLGQRQDGVGTHVFTYDADSRLSSCDGPWANDTVYYAYDAVGQVTNLLVQGGAAVGYVWDSLGRLSAVNLGGAAYQYSYVGASHLAQQLARPNGSITTYRYDGLNRLTGISNQRSTGEIINEFRYTYDAGDMISSETVSNGLSFSLGGNQLTLYSYNGLNQLTSASPGQTFGYDDSGNLTRGFTPNGEAFLVIYDAENRLRALSYTNLAGETRQFQYLYNGYGLLSEAMEYRNSTLSKDARFLRDPFLVLEERDSSNSVVRAYAWGQDLAGGIGGLLDLAQAGQHYSYVYDGNGSVASVLDDAQVGAAGYAYDAFGGLMAKTGVLDQPIRFSTMPYDEGTGLAIFPYRVYSATLGRWLSRDALGEAAGPNAYAFLRNSPLGRIDPLGLFHVAPNGKTPGDYGLTQNDLAVPVCDGQRISMAWLPASATLTPCAQDCLVQHELTHAKDIIRSNPEILDKCGTVAPGTPILPDSDWERASSEMNAYQAQIDCLKKKLRKSPCNKAGLQSRLSEASTNLRIETAAFDRAGGLRVILERWGMRDFSFGR